MSFSIWMDEGLSTPPQGRTLRSRLTLWWGRRLATRHREVSVADGCRISPSARLHPRSGRITLGPRCIVAPGAVLQGNVSLGRNCSVQAYSILIGYGTLENPDGLIRLGNDVRIAPHVLMVAGNHVFDDPARPICEQGLRHGAITIEDDVWVGGRVVITAGVTIGRGSVIGAGAVVTRDIPPGSIAVGVPARVVKTR